LTSSQRSCFCLGDLSAADINHLDTVTLGYHGLGAIGVYVPSNFYILFKCTCSLDSCLQLARTQRRDLRTIGASRKSTRTRTEVNEYRSMRKCTLELRLRRSITKIVLFQGYVFVYSMLLVQRKGISVYLTAGIPGRIDISH